MATQAEHIGGIQSAIFELSSSISALEFVLAKLEDWMGDAGREGAQMLKNELYSELAQLNRDLAAATPVNENDDQ